MLTAATYDWRREYFTYFIFIRPGNGLMEFTGVDKAARSKMGVWKMQEWTYRHDMARVDIAGVDNAARYGKGGHWGSGQISTMWQGWTLQEWTMRHHCGKGG